MAATPTANRDDALALLEGVRARTLALVAPIPTEDLERVHSPLMSPLVWDLGHIAAFEDLWLVHRHGGQPMLRGDLAEVYDAFETPRADRGELPYLRRDEALDYLARVREVVGALDVGDGLLFEMVARHELQHSETMRQAICLARLQSAVGGVVTTRSEAALGYDPPGTGLDLVSVPGGRFPLGAAAEGFAYDNERPRHTVDVAPFRIGRTPVTNATWLTFAEGGGYERREWWSDEGWAWKEEYDIGRPLQWTPDGGEWSLADGLHQLDPHRPVVHVSWFEADAFARAHGARLPTEAEWEMAATWDHRTETKRSWPWGEAPPSPERANTLEAGLGAPVPAGSLAGGASPCGCLGMIGDAWEWTSSRFDGYPGFAAHPYREYSEVFFGGDYRVLRGGSWAASARVTTPTFRNWDHPQRRQIFSGVRIAKDAE